MKKPENDKGKAEEFRTAGSELLSAAYHDLRNHLHHILSFANFGIRKTHQLEPEKIQQYFLNIRDSGDQLLALLNDLMDLTKLKSGRMPTSTSPISLPEIVSSSLQECRDLAAHKGCAVDYSCSDPISKMEGDVSLLRTLFVKLLRVAIQVTPPHQSIYLGIKPSSIKGQPPESTGVGPPGIVASVSMLKAGVPDVEPARLFDRFNPLVGEKAAFNGTGLELAICREIIRVHQGRIWAESGSPDYMTFHAFLPSAPGAYTKKRSP